LTILIILFCAAEIQLDAGVRKSGRRKNIHKRGYPIFEHRSWVYSISNRFDVGECQKGSRQDGQNELEKMAHKSALSLLRGYILIHT